MGTFAIGAFVAGAVVVVGAGLIVGPTRVAVGTAGVGRAVLVLGVVGVGCGLLLLLFSVDCDSVDVTLITTTGCSSSRKHCKGSWLKSGQVQLQPHAKLLQARNNSS